MKEQKLLETINKVETLGQVVQRLMFENENLRTMCVGNHRLLKMMPGFEEAFKKLKAEAEEELKAAEEDTEGPKLEGVDDPDQK